ncbi:hypothetical protein Ssi02_21640 [Sinosporangium siamense]|uniref:Uncharacterized protein n=1 Tax=Sinosporangium siamense TaxID=1367973 RepID=A0A919RDL0_9ACTN|nr:hypothetical protein Ssi02_21640 [Sinosporangium siamense]
MREFVEDHRPESRRVRGEGAHQTGVESHGTASGAAERHAAHRLPGAQQELRSPLQVSVPYQVVEFGGEFRGVAFGGAG